MPAGCEFTCKNEECKHNNTGFIILGPWPLGRIELVLDDPKVKENKEFYAELIKLKKEGRKYVCINYPNNANIPIEGYRIQKWCSFCKFIWNSDAMLKDGITSAEEAIKVANITSRCKKCNGFLMDFDDVLENSIKCPHCEKTLQQSRWFSKEE